MKEITFDEMFKLRAENDKYNLYVSDMIVFTKLADDELPLPSACNAFYLIENENEKITFAELKELDKNKIYKVICR